ncbi:hypothetical protein B0H16DRAFT_1740181 [Mycena metata]|uniref:Uncharacterized protein n=1 Tax=Mycena metata TaxID=1033252 RepID=A0AAD7HDC4_9AGAR|nr:hypothetical protein B0H16DRAFT_1740181 [Mycena metata]
MSMPPPLVANPDNELVRVLGSPAGHTLATKVDDACRLVEHIEISDEEYARRHHWVPLISVGVILVQVMRPSVFIIQQAVDPSFHRTGYGAFEFPYSKIKLLQHALRKIMELAHLISLTDPEYPSYVAIWDGESAVHLMPDEPPVSDQSMGQFEILEYMVEVYGFDGENSEEGREMLAALEHLKHVSTCWTALLGTRGEYPEFARNGRMMRRPASTGWIV